MFLHDVLVIAKYANIRKLWLYNIVQGVSMFTDNTHNAAEILHWTMCYQGLQLSYNAQYHSPQCTAKLSIKVCMRSFIPI